MLLSVHAEHRMGPIVHSGPTGFDLREAYAADPMASRIENAGQFLNVLATANRGAAVQLRSRIDTLSHYVKTKLIMTDSRFIPAPNRSAGAIRIAAEENRDGSRPLRIFPGSVSPIGSDKVSL